MRAPMRTHVIQALVATAAVALAACSNTYPQQPKDPINKDPKPQTAITDPSPQGRGPGLAVDDQAQKPMNDPSVQQPSFGQPSSPEAISQHDSQKPFYGPGLKSPEERDEAIQKAKTQPLASDAEVLSFAMAVNDGEVQMAEMAKKSADNADVKNFAGMMSTHHTQGMAKVRDMQGKTKIELKDNDLTQKVKNDASQNMAVLRDKKGKEFDRLYMDTQVRMHKEALDALDNRVIPAITNGQVKTGVSEMRRQVADHLAKAEQIQKKIDPSLADARKDGDDKDAKAKGTTGTKSDVKVDVKKDVKTDERK
jgi:putative membrane protein